MTRIAMLALVVMLLTVTAATVAYSVGFSDDFACPNTNWMAFDGKWVVEDGKYIQSASGWDLGTSIDVPLPTNFTASVKIKYLGDLPGGGLLFCMANRDNRNASMMVRFDPDGVIYGWFDKDGVFQYQGTVRMQLSSDWHELAVAVSPASGRYSIYVDGKPAIENVNLEHMQGYVGLQSANGVQAFDDFSIRPTSEDEFAVLKLGGLFDAPTSIAVDSKSDIFIGQRVGSPVAVLSRTGKRIASIGTRGTGRFEISNPVAMAFDSARRNLYILDNDNKKVVVLDTVTNQPKTETLLTDAEDPTGLAIDSRGNMFVLDTEKCCLSVYDSNGKLRNTFGEKGKEKGQFDSPRGIAIDQNDRIIIGNQVWWFARLELLNFNPATYEISAIGIHPDIWGTKHLIITSKNRIAQFGVLGLWEAGGVVRLMEPNFTPYGNFSAFSVGALSQRGAIAAGPDDTMYVLDSGKSRICIVPPDLSEPRPLVATEPGNASFAWTTSMAEKSKFRFREENDSSEWMDVKSASSRKKHSAKLSGLKTAQHYLYQFQPTIETIPPTKWSKDYRFLSNPGAGKTALLHFRAVVAIYTKTDLDRTEGRTDCDYPTHELGIKLQRELEKARLYWLRNSRFKVAITFKDYVVIEDKRVKVDGGWIPPEEVRNDLAPKLKAMGKSLDDYDTLICIYARPGYDPDKPDWLGATDGGGLSPFGYSVMGMPGTMNWLFVHEFDHQVDAFFDASGFPEYWFDHPDMTIHPGYFGNQFDVNAHIWRNMPKEDWFWCTYGEVMICDDKDEDGLPDDDPRLAMDERRFGSDPTKKDTDGDGFTDLQEACAGLFTPTSPTNIDTDGDGVIDGKDDYPLYPINVNIPKKRTTIDGIISPGEWTQLMPATGQFINGESYLNWDDGCVQLAFVMDRPFKLVLDIDADADGWFHQTGKYEVRVSALTPGKNLQVRGAEGAEAVCSVVDGKTVLEIRVPVKSERNPTGKGTAMSFRIGFDVDGMVQHLFDPWEMPRLFRSTR